MPTYPASTRQTDFINDLLAKRDVPAELATAFKAVASKTGFDSKAASGMITTLLTMPKKPEPAKTWGEKRTEMEKAFETVPDAFAAIPTVELATLLPRLEFRGDLAFFQVRTYRKRRELFRLSGAPGAFNRYKLSMDESVALLGYLALNWNAAAIRFSDHYRVCGRCAAELTDQKSREARLGSTCRKYMSLVK